MFRFDALASHLGMADIVCDAVGKTLVLATTPVYDRTGDWPKLRLELNFSVPGGESVVVVLHEQ